MAGVGHEKVGHTGQGLWHHAGWQLPAYIQHVANDLIASGHSESNAVQMAVGIIKNWAHGHDGHGHKVSAETAAKAAAALAEWEALKAASKHGSSRMAKYSADELRTMGGKGQAFKNADGSYSYPIGDAEDLANAIHAVGRGSASHNALRKYIIGRAKTLGKSSLIPDNWNPDGSLKSGGRSMTAPTPYTRSFALEDISVRAGDGRTVDAYAAVFNSPTPIRDQDGEYEEIIDPSAFDRAIDHARRTKGGWNIPVMFNHGMTIFQTPSERHSVPIGTLEEIRAEQRGLFTRTRYHKTGPADEVLEAIREGSITAYSFSGAFNRSTPALPVGDKYRPDRRTGKLTTVRRTESTLRELGPATFAAYPDAEIVGVRAEQAAMLINSMSYDERQRLAEIFRSGTPMDPPDDGTPSDEGPAAEDPPPGHSDRSIKQELQAQRAQFLIRHGGVK